MKGKPLITKRDMAVISDSVTGQMKSAEVKVDIYIKKDTPRLYNEPFTMLFQKLGVVTAKSIKPISAKLLLYLCAVVEYGNIINKGAEQIAKEIGYSRRNVDRGLKELEELKIIIIERHASDGRWTLIYLNPFHSWKGKILDRKKRIATTDPAQLSMFPDQTKNITGQFPEQISNKTFKKIVSEANSDIREAE
jgi:DNA-binding transcriptional ArsR family regulator